jgi:hypothetical protein
MKLSDHCKESITLFGEPFEEVHKWLDEFAGKEGIGFRHRKYRHHLKGAEEVRIKFGETAFHVALQHIKSDLKDEGWSEKDGIPKDQEHYQKMGLF